VLVVVLLLPVTTWGPRYYAVAAVATGLAVGSIVALARDPSAAGAEAPAGALRVVLEAICIAVLLAAAILPAVLFPEVQPLAVSGDHPVARLTRTYLDPSRVHTDRDGTAPRRLTVEIWYPEPSDEQTPMTSPLLLYSHGAVGVRTANESLGADLASHGYVVVAVDHPGHSLISTDTAGRRTWVDRGFLEELRSEDARADPARSHRLYRSWLEPRIEDLSFVLDRLLREAAHRDDPPPHGLLEGAAVGVLGHSLGGAAALGLARVRDDIDAVVALEAPFLWDIDRVEDGVFVWTTEPFPVPVLAVYSDSSWEQLAEWPQYAANRSALVDPAGPVTSVHLAGVGHLGLTDLALTSPILTRVLDGQRPATEPRDTLRSINEHTRAFLAPHLRGEVGPGAEHRSIAPRRRPADVTVTGSPGRPLLVQPPTAGSSCRAGGGKVRDPSRGGRPPPRRW
jgi:dienelactone hydrolase